MVGDDHSSSSHLISLLSSRDFIGNEINKFVAFQEFGQIRRIGAENVQWEPIYYFFTMVQSAVYEKFSCKHKIMSTSSHTIMCFIIELRAERCNSFMLD
jgi:hypothetical protein